MQQSQIDNVQMEQQLNSNSKDDVLTSSPNSGNTYVGSSFSTSEIQKMICKQEVLKYNIPCENLSYIGTWELDVASINKNDYLTEFEVKISKSDFKADAKKKKWNLYKTNVTIEQFIKPANYFYYVCPENLLKEDEIPKFCGLMYANENGIYVVKKAPLIHRHKFNRIKLLSKMITVTTERKYLGSCRMTYENNKLRRS